MDDNNWDRMKTNCQKILSYVSKHPMTGITYSNISRELNIPRTTVKYLIQSGKCEEVGLEFGYKTKIFNRKPNVIEAVYWDIETTRKERKINQEDNYKNLDE